MTIQFQRYPVSNRVPGAFIEVDASKANTGQENLKALIVAGLLATGLEPNVAVICEGVDWSRARAGAGSQLANMVAQYRKRDTFGELWVLPLADDPAGVAATGRFTLTGTAKSAGTLPLWIDGQRVRVLVPAGATAAAVAAAAAAACALQPDLTMTATAAGGVLTLTAKHKGQAGNDLDLRVAYLGSRGGEVVPAGLSVAVTPMSGGASNPVLTTALLNLGDEPFDFIALPYTDTASLNAVQACMNDDTGRWSWSRMIYGHVFTAMRGTLGQLTTAGVGRNDQHTTIMGYNDSPDSPATWAAALTAACAASLRADPGLPLWTVRLDVLPPPIQSRFVLSDMNTLLYDGISTFTVDTGGTVRIGRAITTYQRNAQGSPDDSYLGVERLALLAFLFRDLRTFITSQFVRKKIVSDATRVVGNNVLKPEIVKGSIVSRARLMERLGFMQNVDRFVDEVQVEFAGGGLVSILWPGDLVGQAFQFAVLGQFRQTT